MAEYIGVKSYKAKGKRLSTHDVSSYIFLEPFVPEEEETEEIEENVEVEENDAEEIMPSNNESDDNFFSEDDGVQLTLFE